MVYIVNKTEVDYSSAKRYGELTAITTGRQPIFKTNNMIALLKNSLKDFTENDYLLISGPAWLCMLASMILLTKYSFIKFLIFDAKERCYIVRHIDEQAIMLDYK